MIEPAVIVGAFGAAASVVTALGSLRRASITSQHKASDSGDAAVVGPIVAHRWDVDSPDVWDELLIAIDAEERAKSSSPEESVQLADVWDRLESDVQEHGDGGDGPPRP